MKYKIEVEDGEVAYLSGSNDGKQWSCIAIKNRSDLIAIRDVIEIFLKATPQHVSAKQVAICRELMPWMSTYDAAEWIEALMQAGT